MGYIKKLKNNELVGGTDKTTIYPVTSTEAVFEEITNGNESSFKSQKTINKEQQDELDNHEERIQAAEAEDIKSITINGSTKKFEVDDENNVDLTIYTVDSDPDMPGIADNVRDLRNMVGTSTPVLETSHKTRIETLEGGESVTGSVENKIKTKIDSINSSYQDDDNEYVKYSMTQTSGEVTDFNIDETNLKNAIASLNTSISGDNIVIRSGSTPSGTGEAGKIYRYVNSSNNTYTDYMYSGGSWVTLATHDTSNEQAQVAYYTCIATGSGAQAIKQFVGNGSLTYNPSSGGHIKILMGEANTATGTIYLKFGTTSATDSTKKPLYYNGEPASANNTWEAGETIAVYYDPSANNNTGAYFASNAQGGGGKAEKIKYDNSQSGLAADNVQGAIDTNAARISGAGNYIGGVIGSDIIPSSSVGWAQGVINGNTGEIVTPTTDKRCYTSIPINGNNRRINIRTILDQFFVHTVLEYSSSTIGADSFVKTSLFPVQGVYPRSFELTTSNYVVVIVARKTNTAITPTDAGNYAIIEQATENINAKGLNDLQGAGKVVNLTISTWTVGRLDANGANTASDYHLRSPFIYENGIIELYAGEELYIESVFIYDLTGTKTATVVYDKSLERVRCTVESGYISRVVLKRRDGAAMTADMGSLLVASNVQASSRLFSVEKKAADIDVRLTDVEDKLTGGEEGEETPITITAGEYWSISVNRAESNASYSRSNAIPVTTGQRIKVSVSVGGDSYGVWGSTTAIFDKNNGFAIVENNTEVVNQIFDIPSGVNYIFISSRNESFSPPFSPSASLIASGDSWLDEKIDNAIEDKALLNPFKGLKLVTLGDSITQGQVMSGTAPAKPFPVLVAEELGMNLVNYGIGGSTIGTCANYGGTFASVADFNAATKDTTKYYVVMTGNQTYSDYRYNGSSWVTTTIAMRTPLVDRYDLMDNDADIILVAGGTNDFQYNWAEIGEITDNVKTTFRGALNVLCNGLITKYPQKCIIFMTPIKRCQTQQAAAANSDTTAHRGDEGGHPTIDSKNFNGDGITLKEYGDIIKEMCARYSIPVIDMYAECMLNPQLSAQSSLFDDYKTHPLQAGHNLMARLIVGKLRSIFGMNV